MSRENLYVIIMAGGVGSRFWPLSRTNFPKQFHDILGSGRTLLQDTWRRSAELAPEENLLIVTNERYGELVKAQIPGIHDDQVLLEPVGRNTAPCIAYACYKIRKVNPDAVFVVLPSDHLIDNEEEFFRSIRLGAEACAQEKIIMTLGIQPTRPDTGYGYIRYIDDKAQRGFYKVKTFTEKPNREVAISFLESGDYVWNSGIFLFSAATVLEAFQLFLPEMAEQFSAIHDSYFTPGERKAISEVYAVCQPISVDYGIMEKTEHAYVIPAHFGWSDLGTWVSVYENTAEKDAQGNALHGGIVKLQRSSNNIIHLSNPNKVLILKGMEDYILVDTPDALLICPKSEEQSVKEIVNELKSQYGEKYI